VPPDPYERLQTARAAVQARKDERSELAARLLALGRGGDEETLAEVSARLDALPRELLTSELDLARADVEAARATLRAAEASLVRARAELDEAGAPDRARARLETDEHWVRECRLAAERAERRRDELTARAAPGADRPPAEPDDDARHRAFAKRVTDARDAIERARAARAQAELDLVQAAELAKVALEGLAGASAAADWRALEHARQARVEAANAVGPAWEAHRWATLRVARAEYELNRLVEDRLAGR
jgi:hypothetical protein